jgi:hypothetical protein
MYPQKLWAIQKNGFFIKNPSSIGWPYLTFLTKKAALAWIADHNLEGVPVRVQVSIKEVL